jgi:hypothetical protein
MTEENSYHGTVACTEARALRKQMREHWAFPPESMFRYTGNDWLLVFLDYCSKKQARQILLLLWRAWNLRCDATYEGGKELMFFE